MFNDLMVVSDHRDELLTLLSYLLITLGMLNFLPKLEVNRKWAFVPILRFYKIAEAVNEEFEGKVYVFVLFLYYGCYFAFDIMQLSVGDNQRLMYGIALVEIVVCMAAFIYSIRIYTTLCRAFKRKKRWTILWVCITWLPLLIWGCSGRFTIDPKYLNKNNAAAESGLTAEAGADGLAVDINKRVAGDFFKKTTLLKDIHMNIKPGTMVMLLGGSGAGKTTFINAVTGYEKADAVVTLNGVNVYDNFDELKFEIGMVPQQDLMRYNDSVYRTLEDMADLRLPAGMPGKEKRARIDNVLEIFGLTAVKHNIVGKQSGGQKKRISTAMEFMADPYLFVLDEPDSGLDGILARDLMQRLHDISRQGKIVIVITHTPDRVVDLFDNIIVLAKDANRTGRLAFYGTVEEARKFFGKEKMEDVIKVINRKEEGGEGRADELIEKYAEVRHAAV